MEKRQKTDYHGKIEDIIELIDWRISDYFTISDEVEEKGFIESPTFSFVGCNWRLRLYPKGIEEEGYLSIFLKKEDSKVPLKNLSSLSIAINAKTRRVYTQHRTTCHNLCFEEGALTCGWKKYMKLSDLKKRESELIPSGVLTVICCMNQDGDIIESPDCGETSMIRGLEALSSDFKDMLNSRRQCDITIKIETKEFSAHKAVLAARSPVFDSMFKDSTEAKTRVLRIQEADPHTFGDFLSFLYSGWLELTSFRTAYQLYIWAERYEVIQLKSMCIKYIQQNITSENFSDAAVLADYFHDENLKSLTQEFLTENWSKIFLTYTWKNMLRNNPCIIDRLLSKMASAAPESSEEE